MPVVLILLMLCLLLRASLTMSAASAACRLFVTAVLPGLFPYMTLSLMLTRVKRMSPGLVMLLGWGGGSPTGARLIPLCPRLSPRDRTRLAVSCATMSPMFLLGTVGSWLHSPLAGAVCLVSVIGGGWLTGQAAAFPRCRGGACPSRIPQASSALAPLSFGAAIESAARTMLLVCGTMVLLRVFAALAGEMLPTAWILPVTTALEVTTGTAAIASLSLPLSWRTALIAGATGFGGMAIIMQNRSVLGADVMGLGAQMCWQALHGVLSFLISLGLMYLIG